MGKCYRNLYAQICQPLNLWAAFKNATRGKRGRSEVAGFELYLGDNLRQLQSELSEQT